MRRSRVITLALGASLAVAACSGSPAATATGGPNAATATAAASTAASPPASPSAAASPSASSEATASAEASPPASASAAAAGDTVEVTIQDFKFEPAAVEVTAGQTVSWTNEDGEPHTVRSEDGSISSAIISGQPFTWTAEGEPGTEIPYICSIHPQMKGTVTILP